VGWMERTSAVKGRSCGRNGNGDADEENIGARTGDGVESAIETIANPQP
jgi:hypothetical protein